MTNSQMDVFGPGFVPGKVATTRDVASRAMSHTPNTQLGAEESMWDRPVGGFDVSEHASAPNEA